MSMPRRGCGSGRRTKGPQTRRACKRSLRVGGTELALTMERRGNYGYDAPYALVAFAAVGTASLAVSLVSWWNDSGRPAAMFAFYAAFFLANAASFFHTTTRGEFLGCEEHPYGLRRRWQRLA